MSRCSCSPTARARCSRWRAARPSSSSADAPRGARPRLVAAGGKDVRIGGGPTVVREFLKAGLVDRLHVAVVPILLGRGMRLWDDLRGLEDGYSVTSEVAPSGITHLTFARSGGSGLQAERNSSAGREPFRDPRDIHPERDTNAAPSPRGGVDQRELVERAQRGDHDAFAVLAGLFVARLDAAARLILRDHELARDAVQEGFLGPGGTCRRSAIRIASRPGSVGSSFRSCIDVLRRRGRRPIEVELLPIDGPAVADIASIVADRDLLEMAPPAASSRTARAVVVLHYYLGMPLPDVAEALGIPVGTAKSRHHRSLALMRAAIDADLEPARQPVAGGQFA